MRKCGSRTGIFRNADLGMCLLDCLCVSVKHICVFVCLTHTCVKHIHVFLCAYVLVTLGVLKFW